MSHIGSTPLPSKPERRDYWPTAGWRTATPEAQGMDAATLQKLHEHVVAKLPHIRSLLVVRHGYLVFERYYQGCGPDDNHEVASVTKSFLSALVGIALGQGYLASLDQKML